jgi:hypothetical protein
MVSTHHGTYLEKLEKHTAAGMISDADATAINEDMVEATVELNPCSIPAAKPVLEFRMPPARKQHPKTRRMFDRILPSILDWTILISPFLNATMLTWCTDISNAQITSQNHIQ